MSNTDEPDDVEQLAARADDANPLAAEADDAEPREVEADDGEPVTEARIRAELDEIIDPCAAARGTDHSIIDMGLLKAIEVDGGNVTVDMRLTSPLCFMVPYFVRKTEERVGNLPGVESVTLETDTGMEWTPEMMSDEAKARRQQYLRSLEERHRSSA